MLINSNREELNWLGALHSLGIERIVYSGGGAKGSVYPGVYQALHETGVLKGIKQVSGASAGAITATFTAIGMSPSILRDKILHTEFKKLLGETVSHSKQRKPGVTALITKDGQPLEHFIEQNIRQTIQSFLNRPDFVTTGFKDDEQKELQLLQKKINNTHPCITFRDLDLLYRLFPDNFKQLSVTAIRFPDGTPQIFNAHTTPDVEIARACRASSSIPVVLEPVEIDINGTKQLFMDGGLYDNLPTACFDTDLNGQYIENTKPVQTLIFAFGEGLVDKKNPVFQALYGQRWNEILNETILNSILDDAIKILHRYHEPEAQSLGLKNLLSLLKYAIKQIMDTRVTEKLLSKDEATAFMEAVKTAFKTLASQPEKFSALLKSLEQESINQQAQQTISYMIQKSLSPLLYDADWFECFKRNYLTKVLGQLATPYKNTDRKEVGYQKLRSDYTLHTVELRVGDIKTTDFDKATAVAGIMDALGYLDTINHITNHNLHDPKQFDDVVFYQTLNSHFLHIYKAILIESNKDIKCDPLIQERLKLETLSSKDLNKQRYALIKKYAERKLDGHAMIALSLATEFYRQLLTPDDLLKQVYEVGFKLRGPFSISKITNHTIFNTKKVYETLAKKSMFDLYSTHPVTTKAPTRITKTIDELQQIDEFRQAYETHQKLRAVCEPI